MIGRHIANQHSPEASQHWIPIDACHDFPHVVTEFLAYKDKLVPGGLMLFHDVTTNHDFARGTPTWEFWQGYGSRANALRYVAVRPDLEALGLLGADRWRDQMRLLREDPGAATSGGLAVFQRVRTE